MYLGQGAAICMSPKRYEQIRASLSQEFGEWGVVQRTASRKNDERTKALPFNFSLAVFRAVPQIIERLEQTPGRVLPYMGYILGYVPFDRVWFLRFKILK